MRVMRLRRAQALDQVAGLIVQAGRARQARGGVHRLRVAIDGIDAAGKTSLADELAALVEAGGRPVIRASLDGFHQPRAKRYRQGRDSPEGYYQDSYDYPALVEALLQPLGPGGNGRYRRAVFDFQKDIPLREPACLAPPHAVLLLDGIFLLRPELNGYWDLRIFVTVDFEAALQRALRRDLALFGSEEAVKARYLRRYWPAQRHYLDSVRPERLAEVVIRNNDLAHPGLEIRGRVGS